MKWILNTPMIAGAILGWIIFAGYGMIEDGWRHRGSGTVQNDLGDSKTVSETDYRREKCLDGGLLLVVGIVGWGMFAKHHHESQLKKAQIPDR